MRAAAIGTMRAFAEVAPLHPVRRAWQGLRDELRVWLRHRVTLATAARRLAPARLRRIHLGCGSKHRPGWLNLDLHPAADLRLDLREPLPLPDACAEWVYSEHFLEHLAYPGEVGRVLAECRRVLEPGGRLSIGVPDSEWPLREYAEGGEYFRVAK
jgi:SAM-dependent methyltransferase